MASTSLVGETDPTLMPARLLRQTTFLLLALLLVACGGEDLGGEKLATDADSLGEAAARRWAK